MKQSNQQNRFISQSKTQTNTQHNYPIHPQCLEGQVTVIDISNQLINCMMKQKQVHLKQNPIHSNNNNYLNEASKCIDYNKNQKKLIKIKTSQLRRCSVRALPQKTQPQCSKNINPIKIVTNVYDRFTQEFDKMCTYFGLIESNHNQNSKCANKYQEEDLFQNNSHMKYKSRDIQQNREESCFATSPISKIVIPAQQLSIKHMKTEASFQLNKQIDDRKVIEEIDKSSTKNLNYDDKQQLSQHNKLNSSNSSNYLQKEHLNDSTVNSIQYEGQSSNQANSQMQQIKKFQVKEESQIKQQNKRKFQQYKKSYSQNEEIQENIFKHIKSEQNENNEKSSKKKSEETSTSEVYLYLNNQQCVKNNQDQKMFCSKQNAQNNFYIQDFNQSSNQSKKHTSQIIQQSNFTQLDQSLNFNKIKENNTSKQTQYYQELQNVISSKSSSQKSAKETQESLIYKCLYLTQSSITHSIFQSFLSDFNNTSNKVQYKQNSLDQDAQFYKSQQTTQNEIEVESQRKGRTPTCFSRCSATTQQITTLAFASTISISNPNESSISQELIKIENHDMNDNTNSCTIPSKKNLITLENDNQNKYSHEASQKCQNQQKITDDKDKCQPITTLKNDQYCYQTETQKYEKNYHEKCLKFFELHNLTPQQQTQFKFSQYKKKNQVAQSSNPFNQNCLQSPQMNKYNEIKENSEEQSPKTNPNPHKFGRYHNFNKLFMYNVLNMFQPNNLANMKVPEIISKELQILISRIKSSAKNNYKIEGKYAFDYFSHAHYNVLFFQLNNKNIPILSQNEEYLNLYKECFKIDLTEKLSPMTITYINLIKLFCYQIFLQCIREEEIQIDNTMSQENLKNQYTLKVIRGVSKLSKGIIIKRF